MPMPLVFKRFLNNNFSKIGYSLGSNNQSKKQAIIGYKNNKTFYTFLLSETKSDVQLIFDGEFNAMMAMMIKGPISKFIETLATNIPANV